MLETLYFLLALAVIGAVYLVATRRKRKAAAIAAAIVKQAPAVLRQAPTMPPRRPRSVATMPYAGGELREVTDPIIQQMVQRQGVQDRLERGEGVAAETVHRLGLKSAALFYDAANDQYRMNMDAMAREAKRKAHEAMEVARYSSNGDLARRRAEENIEPDRYTIAPARPHGRRDDERRTTYFSPPPMHTSDVDPLTPFWVASLTSELDAKDAEPAPQSWDCPAPTESSPSPDCSPPPPSDSSSSFDAGTGGDW